MMASTDIGSSPVEDLVGVEDGGNADILDAKNVHSRGALDDPADGFHPSSASRPAPLTSTKEKRQAPTSCSRTTLPGQPKSPSPSTHIPPAFLSWMSGRGSTSGQDTSKNSSVNFCRICHEGESGGERLISPCRCSGSVGLIHRSCIEKWLTIVNNDTCELCKQKYSISRHPRPISSWLCEPAVGDDQRNLVGDGACFLLLTPLAGISAYLCASGAAFYFQDKKSEAIGLICLSSLLVMIYMAWLVLTIRYHCQVWFTWRTNNQDIRLLNVSGQRPPTGRRYKDPRSQLHHGVSNVDVRVLDDVEIVITSESSETARVARSSSLSSLPSHRSSTAADLPADISVPVEILDDEEAAENCKLRVEIPKASNPILPLSPNIISCDPQDSSVSKVILSTEDSDIYAQIPANSSAVENKECSRFSLTTVQSTASATQFPLDHQLSIHDRAVSVPYLPDLKEHFIALRSRPEPSTKSVKSRGSFSPNINVTFSFSQIHQPEFSHVDKSAQIIASPELAYQSRPLPPVPGSR